MGTQPKTIAFDFDGVIHKYSKGWQDGSCYDDEIEGIFQIIQQLFENGYSVFILSTRSPRQIKRWLKTRVLETEYDHMTMGDPNWYTYPKYGFQIAIIPWWKKFWNSRDTLGITRRKLPAHAYVDDRAICFTGDLSDLVNKISNFKTYIEHAAAQL